MPATRSSTRNGGSSAASSPPASQTKNKSQASPRAGTKRKAEGTPTKAKRGKKEQKTIDDTMDLDKPDDKPVREGPDPNDTIVDSDEEDAKVEQKIKQAEKEEHKAEDKAAANGHANGDANGSKASGDQETSSGGGEHSTEPHKGQESADKKPEIEQPSAKEEEEMIKAGEEASKEAEAKADSSSKAQDSTAKPAEPSSEAPLSGNTEQVNDAIETNLEKAEPEKAVEQSSSRAEAEPSNILEKGLIYFFVRGRVGIDDPSSVDDIARSYMILRPMPSGAALTDAAPIGDAHKNRIIALPKKVLPASRRDTFLCIVDAADASFDTIKNEHLKSSDYSTKTQGLRHTPAAKPIAEGIYALTHTGRESHLSYILTVPSELGEVQKDIGLNSRGAFITSVKNPGTSAPAGAAPQAQAEYPEGMKKDFRGLRWGRLEPAHLNHASAQFLLIGEGETDKLEKSVQAEHGDGQKEGKEEPLEEMELLSKEDMERIKGLNGDESEAIFKDLGLSKDEYAKIQTSWE